MSRLAQIIPADMNPEQRELFEAVIGGKRARYNLDDNKRIDREGFRGPFNAWMYTPSIGMHAQSLGEELRFEGKLSDRQREIAILSVAVYWKADFEWWAHARIAAGHGLESEVIDAILSAEVPRFTDETERLVYEFAGEVLRKHQANDTLYRDLGQALGEGALVELVTLLGYYVMISMTLNVFRVELPPGETSPFS